MNDLNLIVVVGMHRSGTSATAGVVEILGGKVGNKMVPTKFNPKGYFENRDFYRVNDKILASHKASWDNVHRLTTEKILNTAGVLKEELKVLLMKNIRQHSPFLLKDPRICVLYPLYREIIDQEGVTAYHIQVSREKKEIIKSIMNRDKFKVNKIQTMIDDHYRLLEENISKHVLYHFTFDELLQQPEKVVKNIVEYIPILSDTNKIPAVLSFLDKKLKHHNEARN